MQRVSRSELGADLFGIYLGTDVLIAFCLLPIAFCILPLASRLLLVRKKT
jgi:hypothetical protein